MLFDLQRDDLGVGGDLVGDPHALLQQRLAQGDEVVDVPVEAHMDGAAGRRWGVVDEIVDWMAVGLGDGPHRSPAGMQADGLAAPIDARQALQMLVVADLGAKKADVVAQAAHLGGDLVSERQRDSLRQFVYGDAAVEQRRAGAARFETVGESSAVELPAVAAVGFGIQTEQQGDARGIPASDFQAVDAVEHRIDFFKKFCDRLSSQNLSAL